MLSYRKFDKETDYDIMRRIVQHNCLKTGHLYPQLHIGNLDFERYAFEESPDILYKTIWFAMNNDTEIGFITAFKDEFFITILEEFNHLTNDLLNFIEHNCYRKGNIITTDANSENEMLNSILKQRGYVKTANYRYYGICDLSRISLHELLPDEFSIRLTQQKDIVRRAELFELATGGIGTTPQQYERMMHSPSYCDALDFVVEIHDSEVIAYCTIWNDPISKTAVLEPVACVSEHRRKGIMKNTLLYGMNMMKNRGAKYLYVGTGGKNIASQNLYRSVGFVEYGKSCKWEKTI